MDSLSKLPPEVLTLVLTVVVWPTITGLISLVSRTISTRSPRLWAFLQATGLDVRGAAAALLGRPRFTSRELYELWRSGASKLRGPLPEWEALPLADRAGWDAVAAGTSSPPAPPTGGAS